MSEQDQRQKHDRRRREVEAEKENECIHDYVCGEGVREKAKRQRLANKKRRMGKAIESNTNLSEIKARRESFQKYQKKKTRNEDGEKIWECVERQERTISKRSLAFAFIKQFSIHSLVHIFSFSSGQESDLLNCSLWRSAGKMNVLIPFPAGKKENQPTLIMSTLQQIYYAMTSYEECMM